MENGEQKSELVFELKKSIKIPVKNEPEPVNVSEVVLLEPNNYNLDAFYDFQAMGLGLLRKEMEKHQQRGDVVEQPSDKDDAPDASEMAKMIKMLVLSSPEFLKPSEFVASFKKVIFCKNRTYVRSMNEKVIEPHFRNVHRDDLIQMACEYFAFFGIGDFMD